MRLTPKEVFKIGYYWYQFFHEHAPEVLDEIRTKVQQPLYTDYGEGRCRRECRRLGGKTGGGG